MASPSTPGPQSARFDRPTPAALRILALLAATEESWTIAGLTAELGGHPNTARPHLEQLLADGLVEERTKVVRGRGRPATEFAATLAGRQVAQAGAAMLDPAVLMDTVIEQLAADPDPGAAAVAFGRRWGARLEPRGPAAGHLLGLLAQQGFTPLATVDGIVLRTCPLVDAARANSGIVCGIHQGLVDAVAPESMRVVPFAEPGSCRIVPGGASAGDSPR